MSNKCPITPNQLCLQTLYESRGQIDAVAALTVINQPPRGHELAIPLITTKIGGKGSMISIIVKANSATDNSPAPSTPDLLVVSLFKNSNPNQVSQSFGGLPLNLYSSSSMPGCSSSSSVPIYSIPVMCEYVAVVAKYRRDLSLEWATTITGLNANTVIQAAVHQSYSYVSCMFEGEMTINDTQQVCTHLCSVSPGTAVIKYDAGGRVVGVNILHATGGMVVTGLGVDVCGSVVVTGIYGGSAQLFNTDGTLGPSLPEAIGQSGFLIRIDSYGRILWTALIAVAPSMQSFITRPLDMAIRSDRSAVIVGHASGAPIVFYEGQATYSCGQEGFRARMIPRLCCQSRRGPDMTAQPSSSLADTGFFVVVYSESGKVEQAFSLGLPEIEPRVRVRRDRRAKRSRCPRPCRRVCRPRRRWRDDASDSDDEDIDDEDIDDDIETPRRPDTPASPDTQPNAKVTSDTAGNIIVAVRRFTVWVLTKYDPLGSMLWRTFITTSEAGESAPGTGIPTDLQAFDLTTNIHQEIVCCGEYNTSPVFRNANTDISPVRLAPSSTVGSYLVAFGCDGNVRWVSKQLAKSANTQPSIQAQTLTIDNYQRIFTGSIFKGNPLHLFASDGTVALRVEGMSTQAAVIIAYEEFSQILSMAGSINRPLTKTVELIGTNNSRTLIVNDPEQGAIADKTGNRLSSLVLAGSGATMTLSWINCRWYVTASNQVDLIY